MSDIYQISDTFRAALLAKERAAASEMVAAYGAAYQRLTGELATLTQRIEAARAAGEDVSPTWLLRGNRLEKLLNAVASELRDFAATANTQITDQQRAAAASAIDDAHTLIQSAIGPQPHGVSVNFSRLPTDAVQHLVGTLQDGSPLKSLLDTLGPQAAVAVKDALTTGVALGHGTRQIARSFRQALGGSLTRALTISRTEVLRASRSASLEAYRQNAHVIKSWRWQANIGPRTCSVCLAMDGQEFPLDEPFGTHVNCRCSMLPVTKTWAELGFPNVPEYTHPIRESGEQWFDRQPDDVKANVIGHAGLAAYKAGQVTLRDFVAVRDDPKWGRVRSTRSVADALAFAAARTVGQRPAWIADVEDFWKTDIALFANRRGITPDEWKAQANRRIQEIIAPMQPFMRVKTPNALRSILADGRFKNQFETYTSGGALNPFARKDTEGNLFGVGFNEPGRDRPVYGFFHLPTKEAVHAKPLDQYGKISVFFKPDVRLRATFSVGDSMDETFQGSTPTLAPAPAVAPHWRAVSPDVGDILTYADADDLLAKIETRSAAVPYVEAQFHGGLHVADIAEVQFRRQPAKDIRDSLDAQGIPWRVVLKNPPRP